MAKRNLDKSLQILSKAIHLIEIGLEMVKGLACIEGVIFIKNGSETCTEYIRILVERQKGIEQRPIFKDVIVKHSQTSLGISIRTTTN